MLNPPEYCLFWINWWPMCMQRSDWASWVQAVGSLLALGITILIWSLDNWRTARGAVALLSQLAHMIEGEMRVAIAVAGGVDEQVRKTTADTLREQLRMLRSIDAGKLDLQRAVLFARLSATTESFTKEFDRQNESSSINVNHCLYNLKPLLETTSTTIEALKLKH